MNTTLGRFGKLFALLLSFISLFAQLGPVTIAPLDEENVLLSFDIIADTHIDEIWNGGRTGMLIDGLKDMSRALMRSDALIIAGDMTERGSVNEYLKLGEALNLYCDAGTLLPEMGNHDIRGIKDNEGNSLLTYEYSAGKYFELLDKAAGIREKTVYFYRDIKGSRFIVLNPEGMLGMETVLSDAQLAWLDGLLGVAAGAGMPVFIVNHQPLDAVGADEEELREILLSYDGLADIFFISGHYHEGFSADSITNEGTVYFVSTPAYGKPSSGDYGKTGTGFHAEVYEGSVVFRARDYIDGVWVPQYDRAIPLSAGQKVSP